MCDCVKRAGSTHTVGTVDGLKSKFGLSHLLDREGRIAYGEGGYLEDGDCLCDIDIKATFATQGQLVKWDSKELVWVVGSSRNED